MLPGEAPLPAAVDDLQLSNLDYSLEMSRVLGKIISEDHEDFLFEDHRNTVSEFNPPSTSPKQCSDFIPALNIKRQQVAGSIKVCLISLCCPSNNGHIWP